jgi:hypothetical protein
MARAYRGARILSPATRARLRLSDRERSAARSMPLADRDASTGRFAGARRTAESGKARTIKSRR